MIKLRVVATDLIAQVTGSNPHLPYSGAGSCYVEFGAERVGCVDVDFFSGPVPSGSFAGPSAALASEKAYFGSSPQRRWFGP